MHRNLPGMGKSIFTTTLFAILVSPGLPGAAQSTVNVRAEVRECMAHLQGSVSDEARKAALTDCIFAFDSQLGAADTWKANADDSVSVPYAHTPEELRAFWAKQYTQPGFKLDWWPTSAQEHGAYVVTSGESRMTYVDKSGKTITRTGHYLTVWHRQPDGTYRFAWDGGD